MEKELKCPKCGSANVEIDDAYDYGYGNIDGKRIYFDLCCGGCRDCGTLLEWREIFSFEGYDEIEEAK